MADINDKHSSPRASEGSGAPSFADFSSFRDMVREEREAARAERKAATAEARVEREVAAAEQRRLMAEVYELKLQLAEERRSQTCAVQNGTAIGLDGRRHIEPMRRMGSESTPSPTRSRALTRSRNGDSGAVPIQRGSGESQVKQIEDVPLFDGTKSGSKRKRISSAPRLLVTRFRGGDEEDDDENRSGLQSDRGDDGDGDDAAEYGKLLMDIRDTKKANAKNHDEEAAESETESDFEARAVRLQSLGKANKVKQENAASAVALVAKRTAFHIALGRVIASAKKYDRWPAVVLTKVCTRRALKGLSNCKDKIKMVKALHVQDMEEGRSSPYLDDLPLYMQDESLEPTPVKVIPAGLILALRRLLESGAKRSPSKTVVWENVTYLRSDVLAVIDKEDRVTTGIASTLSDRDSSGRGRGSGSIVQTAVRKTKHCLMRLVCIMVFDRHRQAAVESKLSANRLELDGKVVGANSEFWAGIATDYRDEALHVPNIFSHPLVDDCDPMVLAQPNITSAELSSMWADAKEAWNPAWRKYKSESDNHAPWHDFCHANKDTYIVGAAVEMFPELHQVMTDLLHEGVQREDAGTGGGGAMKGEEQRETAKRAGAALYNLTRNGQSKILKSQRESSAASAMSTAVADAVSSVMSGVVVPALTQKSPPAGVDARARTEESMSKSAVLALAREQGEAHEEWSDKLRKEEALGESGSSFRKDWLQKKISELEATM